MSSPITVAFTNHGATILVEYSDGRKVNMFKPYTISTDDGTEAIGVRNNMYAVQVAYANVTSPASTSLDNLREILESWLEGSNFQQTVSINSDSKDIAGQIAIGIPTPLGDYRHTYNLNDRYFGQLVSGGTVTWDSTYKGAKLTVASNGQYAIHSTFQSHPYYAGFPIDTEFTTIGFNPETNVEKQVVYGDRTFSAYTGLDGIVFTARNGTHYIEAWNSGTKIYEIARASWSDPMDGTGVSGINLGNFSAFCVFSIQWLWLGGAGLGLYAYYGGNKYLIHAMPWSFDKSTLIVSNPQKPLQAGILSTGGAGTFYFICATVKTLGTPSLQVADQRSLYTASAGVNLTGSGTINAILGIRLRTAFRNSVVNPERISIGTSGATDIYRWYLILNPQTIAGTFTYGDTYGSYIASDSFEAVRGVTANAVTIGTGTVIASGVGVGRSEIDVQTLTQRRIGWSLVGVAGTLVLAVEQLSGGTVTINADISLTQRY